MTGIANAWEVLSDEGRVETGWHIRQVHPAAACKIFAGIRRPDNHPGVILELPAEQVPADLVLPRSKGFVVEPALSGGSHCGTARFSLSLADRGYAAMFAILCEDVTREAADAPSARAALRNWVGRLHIWQAFLAKYGTEGLSDSAEIGLLGELLFLRDELAPRVGYAAALSMWAGPRGEPNDFALPQGFVEIKATTRQSPELIEISSPEQLDDERGQILLTLLQLRLGSGGSTLPETVADVRRRVVSEAPERIGDLDGQLLAAGYITAHDSQYTREFTQLSLELFLVYGNFPRITRAMLRKGIRTCSYCIEISACRPYAVEASFLDYLAGGHALG